MKNCMFQYATKNKVFEDTDLITSQEAKELWEKYLPHIIDRWNDIESPQMCIWIDCKNNTNYHNAKYEIYFWDCELEDWKFYKIKKEEIIL